jgi:hypothetical protein
MILARVGLGMTHGARKHQNVHTATTGPTLEFHHSISQEPLHINVTHVGEAATDSRATFDYAMDDIKAAKTPGGQV